jgi:hypothetical protein
MLDLLLGIGEFLGVIGNGFRGLLTRHTESLSSATDITAGVFVVVLVTGAVGGAIIALIG